MSLLVPKSNALSWFYDNWGADPSATPGTSVTPGISNAEGSWTQVASGANIANNVYGFHLNFNTGSSAGGNRVTLADIGVDPAGGTSYSVIIDGMLSGNSPPLTAIALREHFFPYFIKAGSSVAVRLQTAPADSTASRVAMRFYGQPSAPWEMPVGQFSESFGVVDASSTGTAVDTANAAWGTWTSFGTTAKDMWWWQLFVMFSTSNTAATYYWFELAWGDGTNKHTIMIIAATNNASEATGYRMSPHLAWHESYHPVPAGATLYVRGRANGTPDSGPVATIIGIGG